MHNQLGVLRNLQEFIMRIDGDNIPTLKDMHTKIIQQLDLTINPVLLLLMEEYYIIRARLLNNHLPKISCHLLLTDHLFLRRVEAFYLNA